MTCKSLLRTVSLCILLLVTGCGGGHITAPLLIPPALASEQAERLTAQAPASPNWDCILQPAAIRLYPTGEVIVDVLVVRDAVQPTWASNAGELIPEADVKSFARFMTNGISVPARFHSSGTEDSTIVFQRASGLEIRATRAVLGESPFEKSHPHLHATPMGHERPRLIPFDRGGREYNACFVPVLLSTAQPLVSGEQIDVRIHSRRHNTSIDGRWFRLPVEAFDPAAAVP